MPYFIKHTQTDMNLSFIGEYFLSRYLFRPAPAELEGTEDLVLSAVRQDVDPDTLIVSHLVLSGTNLSIGANGTVRGTITSILFFRQFDDAVELYLEIQDLRISAADFVARYNLTRQDRLGQKADFERYFKGLADHQVGLQTADDLYVEQGDGIRHVSLRGGDDTLRLIGLRLEGRTLDGGSGHDRLELHGDLGAMTIDASTNVVTLANGTVARASGFEEFGVYYTDSEVRFLGSKFADRFAASDGDDVLEGRSGNDTIGGGDGLNIVYGGDGNDTILDGGHKDETLDGGAGSDTLVTAYVLAQPWVGTVIDMEAGTFVHSNGQERQFFTGFENLRATDRKDTIRGNDGDNVLDGRLGADLIYGGDGNDTLLSSAGLEPYAERRGSSAAMAPQADTLYGGAGDDEIHGSSNLSHIAGEAGNDRLFGGRGRDIAAGDEGDDRIRGNAGTDELYGGDGNDRIDGGRDNDRIEGGASNDTLRGGDGRDRMAGGTGDDLLFGDAENDLLAGGDGDDRIAGGQGNDIVLGLSGDDLLTGGAGADRFIFGVGHGHDTITDFDVARDVLRIRSAAADGARNDADLLALFTRDGPGAWRFETDDASIRIETDGTLRALIDRIDLW